MRKTAVIIGNEKLHRDLSEIVDNADFTMRFNEPAASADMTGSRTDILVLGASGGTTQRPLSTPSFLSSVAFKAAEKVVLAYHPDSVRKPRGRLRPLLPRTGRAGDWVKRTIELVGAAGKEIRIMPRQFYIDGYSELGVTECRMHQASTSADFFGIRYALSTLPACEWEVKLCGFSWEGVERHSWLDERRWVKDKIASGRISMLV